MFFGKACVRMLLRLSQLAPRVNKLNTYLGLLLVFSNQSFIIRLFGRTLLWTSLLDYLHFRDKLLLRSWWIDSQRQCPLERYLVISRLAMLQIFSLRCPRSIISDGDPFFINKFWQTLVDLKGTKLRMSTAYHPQTGGQIKVLNCCLQYYLHSFVHEKPWIGPSIYTGPNGITIHLHTSLHGYLLSKWFMEGLPYYFLLHQVQLIVRQ